MLLAANPYHCLDHKGRLAGACSEAEPVRPGHVMPMRRWVGARMEMTKDSYVKEDLGGGIDPQADTYWDFVSEPVSVHSPQGQITHYYLGCIRSGELLACNGDQMPLDQLARERLGAVARFKAETGEEPDMSEWEKHFALDPKVAERAAELVKDDEAKAAEEKAAEEKASQERAEPEANAKSGAASAPAGKTTSGSAPRATSGSPSIDTNTPDAPKGA